MNTCSAQKKKICKPKKSSTSQLKSKKSLLTKDDKFKSTDKQDAKEVEWPFQVRYLQNHDQELFNQNQSEDSLNSSLKLPYYQQIKTNLIQKNQQITGYHNICSFSSKEEDKLTCQLQYDSNKIDKLDLENESPVEQEEEEVQIEGGGSSQSSSPLLIYQFQNGKLVENDRNLLIESYQNSQINDDRNLQQPCQQQEPLFSEKYYQTDSQTVAKSFKNKSKKSMILDKLKQIPSYKILPIDFDDLPINEFHLYGDIFISLENTKQLIQNQNHTQQVVPNNNKQINAIFQWKHIQEMKNSKRELIFNFSNKTETKKDFNTIIKIIKARNQNRNLGMLLLEAENRVNNIQNYIKEGFTLMRQNGLIDLFFQRRQLFETKCEFFLRELSGQKKYIYLKSYYNEDKLEIEDSQMGISANFVEILSGQQVNQVVYKIMRGNYPEIFGSKLKELFSHQSIIRLLNLEYNDYQELTFENMELNSLDGLTFPATMTVKRVQFKFDPVFENLPLQDKFVFIEFNISPKVQQQLNKIRKEAQTPKLESLFCESTPLQKQFSLQSKDIEELKKCQPLSNKEIQGQNNYEESEKVKENLLLNLNQKEQSSKQAEDLIKQDTQKLNEQKLKLNAFNSIKNKRRKQRGIIEEDEKDFYYEMQTQILLDKFYDYEEIKELIKQSDQIIDQSSQLQQPNDSSCQDKNFFQI
ncbi:hypothetical protein TTHERM_00128350 (macronuclear) [Tetrahymena thermophila SB210]|uniref:Uncharacterized protein n=1 Tax=Tetrahymena thermophila (strain SB210) TaxID=312017 RepID=I7MEC5_TETTS|nr:hypothetical protein TTHERM_00128350 [Tetrahymena thermophila SB210]EAR96071.1 hypothetical protein TTHERM_00128350 [Tetrahymena thermophila SB210]|eukprot:XP_001016316.1 hypothetical protein TTHERM_00128350 [Tetrahymena thermophila SB210]